MVSLPYLLTSHPYAVLEDDKNVLLLGVLERQGVATPTELARVMGSGPEDIAKRMVALYLNRLVEVDGDVVRLTLHGKDLLDQFAVGETVIHELIGGLESREHRETLAAVMDRFRLEDYPSYLATIRTQRLFAYRWSDTEGEMKQSPRFALLFRDVEDWAAEAKSPAARDTRAKLRRLLRRAATDQGDDSEQGLPTAVRFYVILRPKSDVGITLLRKEVDSPSGRISWAATDQGRAHASWLVRLDTLQRQSAPRDWMRASCQEAIRYRDPVDVMQLWLKERHSTLEDSLQRRLDEPRIGENRDRLITSGARVDRLTALLASRRVGELASSLDLDPAVCRTLLKAVAAQCEALLWTPDEDDPHD
jgi:hypothetical protein